MRSFCRVCRSASMRFGVFRFDAELAGLGAGGVHHGGHAGKDLRREVFHELRIFVDEGLAFGAVGDQIFDLRLRFDVCRKPGSPGPDHTALAQLPTEHKLEDSRGAVGDWAATPIGAIVVAGSAERTTLGGSGCAGGTAEWTGEVPRSPDRVVLDGAVGIGARTGG